MEPSSPPPLRSYYDVTAFQLEPLYDPFLARELEQRRFSKTQEGEWITRIAKDVQGNERATEAVKRWLKAISLSKKREFCNFVPPLIDEAFELFVQFFWLIKMDNWPKANQLLLDARRQWGLESSFDGYNANKLLESGDDAAFSSAALSSWTSYPTGQVPRFMGKGVKSRKTLNAVGRKRNVRSFSSATTKRPITAKPRSKKKRRLTAKARQGANSTNNQDEPVLVDKGKRRCRRTRRSFLASRFSSLSNGHVDITGLGEVTSDPGEIRRGRKRKLGHDDTKYPEQPERILKLPPGGGKRPKVKTKKLKLGGNLTLVLRSTAKHGGVSDGPELLQHSDAKPNELHVPAVGDLVPEPGVLSCSNPNTARSADVDERAPKRTSATKKKSAHKRRRSVLNTLSSRSTDISQTPKDLTEGGTIAELDHGMDHTAAKVHEPHVDGRQSLPFGDVGSEVLEDELYPYGCAPSEYPVLSSIGLEKEQRVSVSPRPLLPVTPPIWAQSRQEVCESLDYFRSYQGGVYHSNDIVKGYLLGAHSSSRDLFHHGGKLIISHGGGKSEALHSKNGRLEIQGPGDQLEDDRSVRALLNNYKSGRPLVVLADDNYALFPFDLTANGYTYVVLGLYWIAHAWAELQRVDENRSVVRYKFAFQWCEGQGDPWWPVVTEVPVIAQAQNSQLCDSEPGVTTISPEEQENLTSDNGREALHPRITDYFCPRCRLRSPLVYQDTPICLQPSCALFCREVQAKLDSSSCAQTLSYSTELLRLQPANHQPVSAHSLYPPLPSDDTTTSRPYAKGMHCRDCGRLSTRFKWENYECSHCHRIYEAPRFVFSHKDFWLQEQTLKFHQHRVAEDSGIVIRKLEFRPRANGSALPYVQTFDLPHNRGCVHLISGHPSINAAANALFQDYQGQAARGEIQFRRWPLRMHKCRGQLLSNYFSQNTGSPYQYVGGAERTIPLEDGAKAVLGALALIQKRITTALGKEVTFNEVLSAAYMEKQKMAFHSDSERGLGPTIASLSLGSAAEMHFRLHSKYADTEGHRKIAMSLLLRHGDVLVMEGAGVQEYYEHAVIPKNFRIVATARLISPENYMT